MKILISFLFFFVMLSAHAQNVGIGTTTPTDRLTVRSASGGMGITQETADGTVRIGFFTTLAAGAYLQTHTNHDLNFATNNSASQMVLQKATGNVGIGTQNPVQGGLVVDRKSGAVNALFGSNTSGVAIESDFPGIGFNTYYFQTRNNIANGFGALISLNPATGNFSIFNTAQSGVAGGLANLSTRLLINKDGNIGIQGNTNPGAPLSFSNILGNKIALWGDPASGHYGVGVQGSLLQLYSGGPNDDIVFGHGRSGAFIENVRMKGNGNVGIGTGSTQPTARLHINGTVRISDGTEGTNKVLISSSNGTATWAGTEYFRISLGGQANNEAVVRDFSPVFLDNVDTYAAGPTIDLVNREVVISTSGVYQLNVRVLSRRPAPFPNQNVYAIVEKLDKGVWKNICNAYESQNRGLLGTDAIFNFHTLTFLNTTERIRVRVAVVPGGTVVGNDSNIGPGVAEFSGVRIR